MFVYLKEKIYFCNRNRNRKHKLKMNKQYASYFYFYFYFTGLCEAGSCV